LSFVDKLKEVDVAGVEPTSHPLSLSNVFRDDEGKLSIPIEEFLKNAPKARGRFFEVPKIIESHS
jgi:aspartyl-tRNA(Asn)/glutamyl-tRNA(Gln) amidotransferase subunit C